MLDLTPQFDDILIQLWLPTTDASGNSQLETKNSPFIVLGGQGDTVRTWGAFTAANPTLTQARPVPQTAGPCDGGGSGSVGKWRRMVLSNALHPLLRARSPTHAPIARVTRRVAGCDGLYLAGWRECSWRGTAPSRASLRSPRAGCCWRGCRRACTPRSAQR
jgi:hypothetical protein